jgi:hypothetical protein
MARKSYSTQDAVEAWIDRQGYKLERQTARDMRPHFRASQGRHYIDEKTGKVREIDLLAQCPINSPIQFYATVECKRGSDAAWVIRESNPVRPDERRWAPITSQSLEDVLTDRAAERIAEEFKAYREFRPNQHSYAFAVVEATDERNDQAFDAISQAVDAARGWLRPVTELALVTPVVVTEAPLFSLVHLVDADEPIQPVKWRRVLWGDSRAQTVVDIVSADAVKTYAEDLRWEMGEAAKTVDSLVR